MRSVSSLADTYAAAAQGTGLNAIVSTTSTLNRRGRHRQRQHTVGMGGSDRAHGLVAAVAPPSSRRRRHRGVSMTQGGLSGEFNPSLSRARRWPGSRNARPRASLGAHRADTHASCDHRCFAAAEQRSASRAIGVVDATLCLLRADETARAAAIDRAADLKLDLEGRCGSTSANSAHGSGCGARRISFGRDHTCRADRTWRRRAIACKASRSPCCVRSGARQCRTFC